MMLVLVNGILFKKALFLDDIKQKFVEKFGVGVSSVDMFELLHTCERYFTEDKALQKVVNIYSRNLPLEPNKDVQVNKNNLTSI